MARGRMISNTLGRSKRYNRLPDHLTKLVYIHALTTADEQGRIEADPVDLYADHFVLDPEATFDRIEAALQAMHEVGLIQLYEVDGKRYAQFSDFHEHNDIRRDQDGNPTREGRSRIPAPPDDAAPGPPTPSADAAQSLRSNRAATAPQVQGEVEDQGEVEGEARTRAHAREASERSIEDSPEARFDRLAKTGYREHAETSRTRATIRRLAGSKFAHQNEDNMTAWSRHSSDRIAELWQASDPQLWPGEAHKRRTWLFADLLNEERFPPGDPTPDRNYSEHVSSDDLFDAATTLEGRWN